MEQKLRIRYLGAIYHVMSRDDWREAVFVGDEDRGRFLQTLGEACEKADSEGSDENSENKWF